MLESNNYAIRNLSFRYIYTRQKQGHMENDVLQRIKKKKNRN